MSRGDSSIPKTRSQPPVPTPSDQTKRRAGSLQYLRAEESSMTRMSTTISVALLTTSVVGCDDTSEPGRVSAARTTDAGPPAGCEEGPNGGVTITSSVRTRSGKTLRFTRTLEPDGRDAWAMETEIVFDGRALVRSSHRGSGENIDVVVEYGAAVTGVSSVIASVSDGLFRGEIDGRATRTVRARDLDVRTLVMADGTPLPHASFPAEVTASFGALLTSADAASDACAPRRPDPRGEPVHPTLLAFDTSVPGHDSDPEGSLLCAGCWTGCTNAAIGCGIAVSFGCATTGPFYLICEVAGLVACAAGYALCMNACYSGGPCCPVDCGDVACCDDEETCMNGEVGLCCSPGLNACAGRSCCHAVDTCIATGPNAGTCCAATDVCGNTCCAPTDTCLESRSLCCPFGSPPCGAECCGPGNVCVHGDQCCPSDRACDGECCPPGTQCNTETHDCVDCPDGGHWCDEAGACCAAGTGCTPVAGVCCGSGEYYCDGACRPASECIL
jgi:hypothetical protein